MFTLLLGLWEVGRITQVQNVLWNSAREAARDASLGQDNLQTVANNLLAYLQAADPVAFPTAHSPTMVAPSTAGITLPSGTYGYSCVDSNNKELFTMTFTDRTTTSVTDPTGMNRLDLYEIGVQVPYSNIGWLPVANITGTTRLYATVDWASMVDTPFSISGYLPAQ